MSAPIFYITAKELASCTAGSTFTLTGPEAHHAKVKRLAIGENLDLADGQGHRIHGIVSAISSKGLEVTVQNLDQDDNSLSVSLVQALAKDNRDILAIETGTELGIRSVIPWSADRSIVRWKGERATKAHQKWQNTVSAAAKQSRRALIPTVEELYSSQELAEHIRELTDQGAYVYILHEQATEPLSEYLRKIGYSSDNPTRIYILVGPEGGITEREIELFTRAGAHKALLGTEILRASTAGAAALCTINVVLGRW